MSNIQKTSQKDTEKDILKQQFDGLNNFLNEIVENQKMNVKHANLMGQKRVNYVKGKELLQFFKDNFKAIKEKFETINDKFNLGNEANENSMQIFYNILFSHKLLLKLNKFEGDKAKYPKQLLLPKKGENVINFEDSKFYWINTQSIPSKKGTFFLVILIFIILMACLFPVWPLKMKIGVLWVVFVFLVALLVILLLMLVISFLGIIVGYDIIFMPNLDEPKKKWFDRLFNPFVAYYKREDDWGVFMIRIFMAFVIILVSGVFVFKPSLFHIAYDYSFGACKRLYGYVLEKFILAPERRKNELRSRSKYNIDF